MRHGLCGIVHLYLSTPLRRRRSKVVQDYSINGMHTSWMCCALQKWNGIQESNGGLLWLRSQYIEDFKTIVSITTSEGYTIFFGQVCVCVVGAMSNCASTDRIHKWFRATVCPKLLRDW